MKSPTPKTPRPLNLNQTTSPAPGKYCPTCYRSGSDLGTCGNFAMGCPDPLPIEADKVVELRCGPCDKTLAVPLADVMKARTQGLGKCVSDVCAATILLPEVKAPVSRAPKPLKD